MDQVNEDQNKLITLTNAYEKLYEKAKKYKQQIEKAEEQVAINASKSKRLQRELEDAEDRAESVTKSILHSRRSSVSKWVQLFGFIGWNFHGGKIFGICRFLLKLIYNKKLKGEKNSNIEKLKTFLYKRNFK